MRRRLLFVLPDLAAGGAQPMNLALARALSARGWQVRLAVLFDRPPTIALAQFSSLPILRLNARGTLSKLRALARLTTLAREADIVIGGMEFAATTYGYWAAYGADKAFLSWTHIAFDRHQYSAPLLDRWMSRLVYRRCPHVVFPSHGAREALAKALGGQPARANWTVIENFLADLAQSGPAPDAKALTKPLVLGIGRLVEQKAFDRLLRAHAALRAQGLDHHLVILGEGPLREALTAQARALGVEESVFLPGHVGNVRDWLRHATVFALCSRYEGFSLALLEALAAGVPAVAMDCPSGPREILLDGAVGRLVPADDEAAFTKALGELLCDEALRAHYAALGRRRALDYTPARIVPRWEALLADILCEQAR